MFESKHHGTFGLPAGEASGDVAELAEQVERLAKALQDMEEVIGMLKLTIENYGPRDLVKAWSTMFDEWRKKKLKNVQ